MYYPKSDSSGKTAVDAVPDLLLQSKPQKFEMVSSFDHLRRLGLERFAPLFHYHGYSTKMEIEETELTAESCAHWCFNLESDPSATRRLKLLLETGGQKLLKHYELAELSTVHDAFMAVFFSKDDGAAANGEADGETDDEDDANNNKDIIPSSTTDRVAAAPLIKRSNSQGFPPRRCNASLPSESLTKQFVDALTSSEGKSMISAWQLRWLLRQNGNDPQAAVDAAIQYALLSYPKEVPPQPPIVQAYDVLRRLGIKESVAHSFEADGFVTAKQLKEITDDGLKGKISDPATRAQIKAVLACKKEGSYLTRGFLCPDRATIRQKFKSHFPEAPASLAHSFAIKLTDPTGFGLASHIMIDTYLTSHSASNKICTKNDGEKKEGDNREAKTSIEAAQLAVDGAIDALVTVIRTEPQAPPPSPEPTDFVHLWLKEAKLEKWSCGFINEGICTKVRTILPSPSLRAFIILTQPQPYLFNYLFETRRSSAQNLNWK